MNECIKTGAPLNPPIWWVDPTDKTAHKINDGKLRIYINYYHLVYE